MYVTERGHIMAITRYEDMDDMSKDMMREIGSIGTGNAATSLSSLLGIEVEMTVPNVEVEGYNEAVECLGNPEEIISGVLVQMSGDISGIMLFVMRTEFINEILKHVLQKSISDFTEMGEMEISAATEVGNIIISSYVLSLSKLADMDISLSVPGFAINMLGGIMTVPMAELGYESDKLLMIRGKCIIGGKHVESNLLMLPDIKSLNYLMDRLVKPYE